MKILVSVLLALSTLGGATANPTKSEVDRALAPLRQAEGVTVRLKKRSLNSLLAREKTSVGRLHYWKGKLRVETESPDETLLILDGKTLWLVTTLPEDMGGKTLVSKTSAGSFKKSNTFFAALLGEGKLLKEFKITGRATIDDDVHLELAPKVADQSEIQKLDLWLKSKDRRLAKVVYWDDKENEVTYELGEPEKINGDRKALFSYKPPKGAEVTEF